MPQSIFDWHAFHRILSWTSPAFVNSYCVLARDKKKGNQTTLPSYVHLFSVEMLLEASTSAAKLLGASAVSQSPSNEAGGYL